MLKRFRNQTRGTAFVLAFFFIVLGAGAWYSADLLYTAKYEKLTEKLEQYQEGVIATQTEMISTHLVDIVLQGRELAKSRIFRRAIANFASMKQAKKDQAQEDFENFVKTSGFWAGHLFDLEGRLMATTLGKLDAEESAYYNTIKTVAESRTPYFSALHMNRGEMVSELYIPVYPTGALSDSAAPNQVLILVVPLRNVLRAFLMSTHELKYGTKVSLVQMRKGQFQRNMFERVTLAYPDTVKLQRVKASLENIIKVKFGKRQDLLRTGEVYSSVEFIPAVRWWLALETDTDELDAALLYYKNAQWVALVMGGIAAILLTSAISFSISRRRHLRENEELKEELFPLRRKHEILETIADSLTIPMCLRNMENGSIVYVNEAFASLCGKPRYLFRDLTFPDLFSDRELASLTHGDQMLSMSDEAYTHEVTLYQGPNPDIYSVTGIKLKLDDEDEGILLTFREVTEELETNTRNIEMRQQIIDALVRAVESVPFLDGHTALLRQLSMSVAETLLLSDADCSTVEAAAILSQVGKTFVPKQIMEKDGKLTPEEILETQRYVEHTCRIIEGIDFHLPITQTIWQIQESLDGSGYPNGLQGDEISVPARILGVANTFSAIVQKRSYRKAKTAREAVEILWKMADSRFDSTVIRALEAVVDSPRGQKMLRQSGTEIG